MLTQHQLNTRRRMREHGTHIGMQNHILPCTTAYWAHTALPPQCEYTLGRNLTNVLIAIRMPRIRWQRNCTQDTKIAAWACGHSLALGVNVHIAMHRVPLNYFHIPQFGTFILKIGFIVILVSDWALKVYFSYILFFTFYLNHSFIMYI